MARGIGRIRQSPLLFVPGLMFAISAAAFAQDLSNPRCMSCHEKEAVVDAAALQSSVHAKNDCVECHSDVEELPHPPKLKRVGCGKCHAEAAGQFGRSIHRELARQNVPDTPTCATCHGTHDIARVTDIRSRVHHLQIDHTCLKCHAQVDVTRRHPKMPSPEFAVHYEGSVHGRAVHLKGLVVAATCSNCHGHHDMRPKSDPQSSVHPANVPTTCKTCHVGIYESWMESAHGRRWAEKKDGPVCTTCHSAHEIRDPTESVFRIRTPENCGGCHKEESSTYRDTFHGKATSLGFAVAATCSDCHTPHRNLPKEDAASSVHPERLVATCGRCHKGADASLVRYDPHLDVTNDKRSPVAFYVHHGMVWLLAVVFGFFGVHTALWIQRVIVALLRKEMSTERHGGPYVRRFSFLTVVLHVTVVISFLILVSTGIPLRYHESGWAHRIVDILGGIEVTRFFHRLCAVGSFGYAVTHVGWLAFQVLWRRKTGLLFGPDSLVPRLKDVADLWRNVRWFLYLGKPPQFGRWTYFEKFDYFAVFWGLPVIGISGLMLWFPGVFSRFLPGDAL
ncbi:MAG: hypothetical protein HYY16_01825, partial [Planctomycetes bacterium]|nr:hypothetical protein [Planctomycetota bacterium]